VVTRSDDHGKETATHRPGGFLQVVCVKRRQRTNQRIEN
jgi:hypothetical protein